MTRIRRHGNAFPQVEREISGFEAVSGAPASVVAVHTGDDGIELTIVTMTFDTSDPERLAGLLATYVLLSRAQPGCRNVDLATSVTRPSRFVVIQKWDSPEAQQAHFDSAAMIDMATGCDGLLTRAPDIDLLEPISAHDLA